MEILESKKSSPGEQLEDHEKTELKGNQIRRTTNCFRLNKLIKEGREKPDKESDRIYQKVRGFALGLYDSSMRVVTRRPRHHFYEHFPSEFHVLQISTRSSC